MIEREMIEHGVDHMTIRIKHADWLIVCDGRKALFFENEGDAEFPILVARDVLEHRSLPNRDLVTDRPGRVHESATTARSSIEPVDYHDMEETAFLASVSKRLDEFISAGTIRHLTMVAPPRALGAIRKIYSPALRAAIRAEVDQDLVKMPVAEIQKKFAVRGSV